ncbi:hypothetical protein [Pseudothioclava nitratireducens]|uniref:hypothetical protein n=1 Tax=Pseudothioclava nitratireducens TaxID=1928646 RepID=UPI0023DC2658|nr:hypothetical protein [Defluviimonas nitratireducens]MDF1621632.1 hypothetical protein [Defluviimonas nitratireducens]
MTYNFLLAMAAQKLMPNSGEDLIFKEPPAPPARLVAEEPLYDPAPQVSVRRFDVEIAGKDPEK